MESQSRTNRHVDYCPNNDLVTPNAHTLPVPKKVRQCKSKIARALSVAGLSFTLGAGASMFIDCSRKTPEKELPELKDASVALNEESKIHEAEIKPEKKLIFTEDKEDKGTKCHEKFNEATGEGLLDAIKCYEILPKESDFEKDKSVNQHYRAVFLKVLEPESIKVGWEPLYSNQGPYINALPQQGNLIAIHATFPEHLEKIRIGGYFQPVSVEDAEDHLTRLYYLDSCTVDLSQKRLRMEGIRFEIEKARKQIAAKIKKSGGEASLFYFNQHAGYPTSVAKIKLPACEGELKVVTSEGEEIE